MSFHAANPAGFSDLSSCAVESANQSLLMGNYSGELRPPYSGFCRSSRIATWVDFGSQCADENFAWPVSAVIYPVFCSVTASGPFRRPAALGLLLRLLRPFGVTGP